MARNITLAVDDEILDKVQAIAARRGTTVTALVREYLTGVASSDDRVAQARAEIIAMSGRDGLGVGARTWSRGDLHGR